MSTPGNAAAPGVGTEGERKDQQGRADDTMVSPEFTAWVDSEARERVCSAVRRRRRLQRDVERSRASRELDVLLEGMYPGAERLPSTYGLSPDARRSYASHLMANGWQAYEVRARIAAPEVDV